MEGSTLGGEKKKKKKKTPVRVTWGKDHKKYPNFQVTEREVFPEVEQILTLRRGGCKNRGFKFYR